MTATTQPLTFRPLEPVDGATAIQVINDAAQWYATFLPMEELPQPEMTLDQWHAEGKRMQWFGAFALGSLRGVMGLEPKLDALLIRHAYVAPPQQRAGIGSRLLAHLEAQAPSGRLLIAGTYALNYRARALFEKHRYALSQDSEAVLRKYFAIPEDRLRTSVTYVKLH